MLGVTHWVYGGNRPGCLQESSHYSSSHCSDAGCDISGMLSKYYIKELPNVTITDLNHCQHLSEFVGSHWGPSGIAPDGCQDFWKPCDWHQWGQVSQFHMCLGDEMHLCMRCWVFAGEQELQNKEAAACNLSITVKPLAQCNLICGWR